MFLFVSPKRIEQLHKIAKDQPTIKLFWNINLITLLKDAEKYKSNEQIEYITFDKCNL